MTLFKKPVMVRQVTVNGMFPGPTIYAREGDRLLINVTNSAHYNIYTCNAGEWWNNDVDEIVKQGNKLGLPDQIINGKPGPLFPWQTVLHLGNADTFAMEVERGKTYLLRIINAALNDHLFFAVAGHNMTTSNVLIQANQSPGRYFMAARPFMDAPLTIDNKTVTAILQYRGVPSTVLPILPQLPYFSTSFLQNWIRN
ncbi:hypothetical protein GQ457_18G017130 [Hibiscus cannabinus]